ncbi:MAG: hypothetical protein C0518_01735 [Opitutus sp.]|nr:hypothetical protein [Opitutus sp.]
MTDELHLRCDFSGLVLAGGRSTRMGRDKAFLRVDGERLIDRQLAILRALGAREVFVSGRRGVNYRVSPVNVHLDRLAGCGPAGGILRGLQVCRSRFLFVLAVDLPAISPSFAAEIARHVAQGRGVVPRHDGLYEPLAAIYPRSVLPLWETMVNAGQCSLQDLIGAAVRSRQLASWSLTNEQHAALVNWNCPADWGAPAS